jgi:hypothetical protein
MIHGALARKVVSAFIIHLCVCAKKASVTGQVVVVWGAAALRA